ncbi:hypothetical protein SUGI_0242040 [Cryptomeria japonica]|uniref:uncharacterized protein LOC131068529 n=1 Tax=Cryptomeria japonica TaxID=3369 RepID=UPI002408C587|nr:uncharacterized protein LOC131068529 [Cryptomeria japonica]GLJ14877.1 hypothetical protein SUGI_0242040 [Cryptomeria japonica]
MPLQNLKDVFTAFSPSADFLAITTGDGRIKIWDTVNGQMQSEFSDIAASNLGTSNGHLSVDYSCMKWSPNMGKKKKKGKKSLLVLGTGVGDVLALDPMLGEVKWRCSDCHPGGTMAISFASNGRVVYTTGVDGMVCELDSETGNLLEKFRASKKAISCLAVSSDGRSLATAGAELKHFSLPDKKKLQKFTGHPNSVRVMMFATSGKHIISSAAGERHVAVWKCDGSKESRAAACVLSMEQPAVALDCKAFGDDGEGLSVLAVSESGVAYIWHSESVEELTSAKPSKVTVSLGKEDSSISKSLRKSKPCVFAAKLQGIGSDSSLAVLVAYGNLVKPSFERLEVMKKGKDIILSASESGMLLAAPHDKSPATIEGQQNGVTALGPANAEDAIFPIPRVEIADDEKHKTKYGKKRRASDIEAIPNEVGDDLMKIDRPADGNTEVVEDDNEPTMEEKLMQLGIIEKEKEDDPSQPSHALTPIPPNADSVVVLLRQALRSNDMILLAQCLDVRDPMVRRNSVYSLSSADALKLFKSMVHRLKSGPRRAPYLLPWIKLVLLRHASSIMSDESSISFLNTLYQMIESRVSVFWPLLQLSGRLDLINEQISPDMGDEAPEVEPALVYVDESEEEDEEELVDEAADMSADESDDGSLEDVVTLDQVVDNGMMNAGSGRDSDEDL